MEVFDEYLSWFNRMCDNNKNENSSIFTFTLSLQAMLNVFSILLVNHENRKGRLFTGFLTSHNLEEIKDEPNLPYPRILGFIDFSWYCPNLSFKESEVSPFPQTLVLSTKSLMLQLI